MGTLRDLYLRVMSAIDSAHPTVKADVDAAFAEHEAAAGTVSADDPPPAPAAAALPTIEYNFGDVVKPLDQPPLTIVPAVDLSDAPAPDGEGA